jgi:hypothetical protein
VTTARHSAAADGGSAVNSLSGICAVTRCAQASVWPLVHILHHRCFVITMEART